MITDKICKQLIINYISEIMLDYGVDLKEKDVITICDYAYDWYEPYRQVSLWQITKTIMHFVIEKGVKPQDLEKHQEEMNNYICTF